MVGEGGWPEPLRSPSPPSHCSSPCDACRAELSPPVLPARLSQFRVPLEGNRNPGKGERAWHCQGFLQFSFEKSPPKPTSAAPGLLPPGGVGTSSGPCPLCPQHQLTALARASRSESRIPWTGGEGGFPKRWEHAGDAWFWTLAPADCTVPQQPPEQPPEQPLEPRLGWPDLRLGAAQRHAAGRAPSPPCNRSPGMCLTHQERLSEQVCSRDFPLLAKPSRIHSQTPLWQPAAAAAALEQPRRAKPEENLGTTSPHSQQPPTKRLGCPFQLLSLPEKKQQGQEFPLAVREAAPASPSPPPTPTPSNFTAPGLYSPEEPGP